MQRKAESAHGGRYQSEMELRVPNKWMAPTCLQWIQQLFNFVDRGQHDHPILIAKSHKTLGIALSQSVLIVESPLKCQTARPLFLHMLHHLQPQFFCVFNNQVGCPSQCFCSTKKAKSKLCVSVFAGSPPKVCRWTGYNHISHGSLGAESRPFTSSWRWWCRPARSQQLIW